MSHSETRVVLVKPGDVLIFGNVGDLDPDAWDNMPDLKQLLGLKAVALFEGDIDLAVAAKLATSP